jgi:hypothetical protein
MSPTYAQNAQFSLRDASRPNLADRPPGFKLKIQTADGSTASDEFLILRRSAVLVLVVLLLLQAKLNRHAVVVT